MKETGEREERGERQEREESERERERERENVLPPDLTTTYRTGIWAIQMDITCLEHLKWHLQKKTIHLLGVKHIIGMILKVFGNEHFSGPQGTDRTTERRYNSRMSETETRPKTAPVISCQHLFSHLKSFIPNQYQPDGLR